MLPRDVVTTRDLRTLMTSWFSWLGTTQHPVGLLRNHKKNRRVRKDVDRPGREAHEAGHAEDQGRAGERSRTRRWATATSPRKPLPRRIYSTYVRCLFRSTTWTLWDAIRPRQHGPDGHFRLRTPQAAMTAATQSIRSHDGLDALVHSKCLLER